MSQSLKGKNLTKEHLVNILANEIGVNKREATELVYSFFDLVKIKLVEGHTIRIAGLGLFNLTDKGSRPGRNIKTKEEVAVCARRVVTFKAGVKLKNKIESTQKSIWTI